ncbi:hypothetical protein C8R43DRAFT_1142442 [Mycena crocata]|nr:hypothetical protein C8R43DRAFT_1142442 [Mycena crocata]
MHPAFRLSNLDRLPPTLRKAAKIACSANATGQDMLRVRTYMATATEQQHNLLLPVFYTHLDPAGVPNEDQFDTDSPPSELHGRIARAFQSLEALYVIQFPADIGPTIWPRVWPWIQFLYLYRTGNLPGLPLQSERVFCLEFLMFAGTFTEHPATYALMLATSGLRYMVAKAWRYVPAIPDPKKREVALSDLRAFVADEHATDPLPLAELVDGAGGTLDDLAWLMVSYIHAVVPAPGEEIDDLYIHFVRVILRFIGSVEPRLGEPSDVDSPLGAFAVALFSQGIVPALCTAARSVVHASETHALHALHEIMAMISVMFYRRTADECITRRMGYSLRSSLLSMFFGELLPAALVYYRVLCVLDDALDEVAELVKTDVFKASEIHEEWITFLDLANQRLDLRVAYDEGDYPAQKACDNLKCTEIALKSKFERCSGCLSFYYCSRACQKVDWREGGHRTACELYCKQYFNQERDVHLDHRQRSFTRALVQHDYKKLKALALIQQVIFKEQKPGQQFVTLYKYTTGAAEIEVRPLGAAALPGYGGAWADTVRRVAASGGRMLLDVVVMGQGAGAREWVLPMRTNMTALHDELQEYLATLPADRSLCVDEEMMPRLEAIIYAAKPGVVVIR